MEISQVVFLIVIIFAVTACSVIAGYELIMMYCQKRTHKRCDQCGKLSPHYSGNCIYCGEVFKYRVLK